MPTLGKEKKRNHLNLHTEELEKKNKVQSWQKEGSNEDQCQRQNRKAKKIKKKDKVDSLDKLTKLTSYQLD